MFQPFRAGCLTRTLFLPLFVKKFWNAASRRAEAAFVNNVVLLVTLLHLLERRRMYLVYCYGKESTSNTSGYWQKLTR